jgi:hypothetical protein
MEPGQFQAQRKKMFCVLRIVKEDICGPEKGELVLVYKNT